MNELPDGLAWLRGRADGRAWLAAVPELARECAGKWDLQVGRPFPDAFESLCLAAQLPGGGDGVLKLQFPGPENELEAAALAAWDGEGAVRLLAHDPGRHALLLERARPGVPLSELEQDDALDEVVELLPRLWRPAGEPFRPLEDEARGWAESLPCEWERASRPFERRLLDAALAAIEELAPAQGAQVLVHQDLHTGNVLRAERQPWLAIDPKPLAGERELGIAALVRGRELGHSRERVLHRLDRLAGELGLDRDRARGWALAQTLAWAFDDNGRGLAGHVDVARWLLDGAGS